VKLVNSRGWCKKWALERIEKRGGIRVGGEQEGEILREGNECE